MRALLRPLVASALLLRLHGHRPRLCRRTVGSSHATRDADTRRIHALIVGIDHYRNSDAHLPGAVFSDLRGAVGDALRFKQALAELYGVDVDVPARGACDSSNAATTTLTDGCATRSRIIAALEQRIATLQPGRHPAVLFRRPRLALPRRRGARPGHRLQRHHPADRCTQPRWLAGRHLRRRAEGAQGPGGRAPGCSSSACSIPAIPPPPRVTGPPGSRAVRPRSPVRRRLRPHRHRRRHRVAGTATGCTWPLRRMARKRRKPAAAASVRAPACSPPHCSTPCACRACATRRSVT